MLWCVFGQPAWKMHNWVSWCLWRKTTPTEPSSRGAPFSSAANDNIFVGGKKKKLSADVITIFFSFFKLLQLENYIVGLRVCLDFTWTRRRNQIICNLPLYSQALYKTVDKFRGIFAVLIFMLFSFIRVTFNSWLTWANEWENHPPHVAKRLLPN